MIKTTTCTVVIAMLTLGTGCGASVQASRVDATAFHSSSVSHAPMLADDTMPGDYAVSWTAPTVTRAARESSLGLEIRPENASKKGRLLVGSLETTSFK